METISIKDVGPVTEARIDIQPGVVVITGRNEAGKSTCIAATSALAGRDRVGLTARDGTKCGLVEGLGTVLKIGDRVTRTGELEVESVEDRLDLAALVDPGLKEANARNRKRIRALISLTGIKLEVRDFAGILPESMLAELVDEDASEDPVEMAGNIKRRMERKAREHEAKAETAEGKAQAIRDRIRDVNVNVEHDAAVLQQRLIDATREQARLAEQARAAAKKAEAIEEAKRTIADRNSSGAARVAAAEAQLNDAAGKVTGARNAAEQSAQLVAAGQQKVRGLQQALAAAEAELTRAETAHAANVAAQQHAEAMHQVAKDSLTDQQARLGDLEALSKLAAESAPEGPDPADLEAAQDAVTEASAAIEEGIRVRAALVDREHLEEIKKVQADHVRTAEVFRAAAKGTDDVLSGAVDCETLKVVEGELTYVDNGRKEEFDRLSDGKRWTTAIAEVARSIRKHRGQRLCVLPIQQPAWEGLDSTNRTTVHNAAVANNVCVVTAEHSDGPLSSYAFQG